VGIGLLAYKYFPEVEVLALKVEEDLFELGVLTRAPMWDWPKLFSVSVMCVSSDGQ
jgi:hypothetical protein